MATVKSLNDDIRVLIADNDHVLLNVIAEMLIADGYQVTCAENAKEIIDVLGHSPFDIVIVDLRIPGMAGLELLKEIKSTYMDIQVITVTSNATLESAVEALRAGAYDYLTKPFEDVALVSAAVSRLTEKIHLIRKNIQLIEDLNKSKEELERMNETLLDLSVRDGLTGIHNHRYFQEFLASELSRSPRYENEFSLLFIDIDHFKNYNDTHGHVEGDSLLCEFAKLLVGQFRKMDLVARYGGEEFTVLLPNVSIKDSHRLAIGLCQYIEKYPFRGRHSQPGGRLTVSIGVASYPDNGSDAESLIRSADKALYNAKRGGRNRVCIA